MPAETITKKDLQEHEEKQAKLLKEFREIHESKDVELGEVKEKLEKVEKDLNLCEEFNQKVTKMYDEHEALKTQAKELAEDLAEKAEILKALEKKYYRDPQGGGESEEKKFEMDEVKHFFLSGQLRMKSSEYKYLRTDNDEDGGFLVPPGPLQDIIKKLTETSDMRSICRVIPTANKSIPFPSRISNVSVAWVGEGEEDSLTNQKYGREEIFTYAWAATVPITMEEMQDSAFNMDSEIFSDVAEAGAQHEGNTFINGIAANQPEGFLNNPNIQVVNSTIANSFDADSLMDVAAELKTGYRNPLYIMSRRTLNHVRKLKDGSGAYLLVGLRDGLPNTINGYPYREMPDMPEITTDAKSVAFGEFRRGYVIVDRIGMTMIRDIYTQKRKRIIELTFSKRVGGQVILPEAIKILKCAV